VRIYPECWAAGRAGKRRIWRRLHRAFALVLAATGQRVRTCRQILRYRPTNHPTLRINCISQDKLELLTSRILLPASGVSSPPVAAFRANLGGYPAPRCRRGGANGEGGGREMAGDERLRYARGSTHCRTSISPIIYFAAEAAGDGDPRPERKPPGRAPAGASLHAPHRRAGGVVLRAASGGAGRKRG